MESELLKRIADIKDVDWDMYERAWQRQDSLAKPPRSLGVLEEISARLAAITGKLKNSVEKRNIMIYCADNGVVEENVSSAPQSVTLAQMINFTRGKTGVAALAKNFDTELTVVDVGVNADYNCPAVLNKKIRYGTANLYKEHAMTREECVRAIEIGMDIAEQKAAEGFEILGVGEMGIGNTTTSSAVLCALCGLSVDDTVGKGGGITKASFEHKKEVVAGATAKHKPDANDPIDVLAKVGGLDIAAMAGAYLGAARARVPVVIDGFISVVAALVAYKLNPLAKEYMLPSHASYEIGYDCAIRELGLQPILLLGMRLGEGSGCPIAFMVAKAATAVMNDMATFDEAEINDDYLEEIRKEDSFSVDAE